MIPKPKDATWVGPWEQGQRLFDGQTWTVEHTTHNGRPYPSASLSSASNTTTGASRGDRC